MILWVRKKLGAESSFGRGSDITERGFRASYTVKSSVVNESRNAILTHPDIPRFGYASPEDPASVVVKVVPRQRQEDPTLWDVDVEWSSVTNDKDPRDEQEQPDERRPKWSFQFQPLQKAFFHDLDGKPFVNRAGTPISPPPEIPIYVDEVTITRYESTVDRSFDRTFLNATNSDKWLGEEPSTALIVANDATEVFISGAYWFQRTFRILVSPRIEISGGSGTVDNAYNTSKNYTEDTIKTIVGGWHPFYTLNAGHARLQKSGKDAQGHDLYKAVPIEGGGYVDGQAYPLDDKGEVISPKPDGTWSKSLLYLGFRTVNRVAFKPLRLIPPWL